MKNLIRGFFNILFMFVIPFLGTTMPIVIPLGYFIESNIIVGIIATVVFFMFSSSLLINGIAFIASIIIPVIYGDFGLALISIIFIVLRLASPFLLGLIYKKEEL